MDFEAFEHDSRRGSLKLTKLDFENGLLEFEVLEAGGDGVYGKNELTGTVRFRTGEASGIYLLGVSGKGRFKLCDNDDYEPVTLAAPKKNYIINLPARFKVSNER